MDNKVIPLELRTEWIVWYNGHNYVRTQIIWQDDRPVSYIWRLNEDQKLECSYASDEELEEYFDTDYANTKKPIKEPWKTIKIAPTTHHKLKDYCDTKCLKMNEWVNKSLNNQLTELLGGGTHE